MLWVANEVPTVKIVGFTLTILGLCLMISACVMWAVASHRSRPKYRDEQTLVGGAIWSQILTPIGLLLTDVIDEHVNKFIRGYFLATGFVLLLINGIVIIVYEIFRLIKQRRRAILREQRRTRRNVPRDIRDTEQNTYHGVSNSRKLYISIGVLSLFAGSLKIVEYFLLLFVE